MPGAFIIHAQRNKTFSRAHQNIFNMTRRFAEKIRFFARVGTGGSVTKCPAARGNVYFSGETTEEQTRRSPSPRSQAARYSS